MFLILLATTAHADISELGLCQDAGGNFKNIKKLVCQTTPALLKAMNPDVTIPRCEDQPGPRLQPGHLPTSAVFLTCTGVGEDCSSVGKALVDGNRGETLNFVFNSKKLGSEEFVTRLSEVFSHAKSKNVRVNAIPVDDSPYRFTRDAGVFLSGNQTEYWHLPLPRRGALAMDPVMSKCGIPTYKGAFEEFLSMDLAYERMKADDWLHVDTPEFDGLKYHFDGGNLLPLPGGIIAVGRSASANLEESIISHFRKNHQVESIEIPELKVGHIDEVFSIAKAPNKCGFVVLRASPIGMKKYLETVPPDKTIYFTDRKFNLSAQDPKKRMEESAPVSAGELLNNERLMEFWNTADSKIKASSDNIEKAITSNSSCKKAEFVDLPVLWDLRREPVLPNPVNGLTVNGRYYYSQMNSSLFDDDDRMIRFATHDDLTEHIKTILKEHIPESLIQSVDSTHYNYKNGNLHCATLNIHIPCVP